MGAELPACPLGAGAARPLPEGQGRTQSLFFSQPAETVGDLIASQMEPVVLTLLQTAHVPEKAINPIVGERSADIGNVLNSEWIRVVRGQLPLYDFIENVSDRIDAILQGK